MQSLAQMNHFLPPFRPWWQLAWIKRPERRTRLGSRRIASGQVRVGTVIAGLDGLRIRCGGERANQPRIEPIDMIPRIRTMPTGVDQLSKLKPQSLLSRLQCCVNDDVPQAFPFLIKTEVAVPPFPFAPAIRLLHATRQRVVQPLPV